MTFFEIRNEADRGFVLGIYEGATDADAIDAMARDAGYRDQAHALAEVGDNKWDIVAIPQPELIFEACDADDIRASDLREEIGTANAAGEKVDCYELTEIGEDGYRKSVTGSMIYFPKTYRAGIAWGGDASWTDASSPEEALHRYQSGEMVE